MGITADTPRWLEMPTVSIAPKIVDMETDLGLPNGISEHVTQRIDNGVKTIICTVGDNWISMKEDETKGHKVTDSEMDTLTDALGMAIGKPLKSDNEMKALGWPSFQDDVI